MCKFKENIAISCGIKAAIVAQFIWDNIKLGSYDGNIYEAEGKTWCRCSMLMMTGFFPFMTKKMIRNALNELVRKNIIKKGCFNDSKFDHTNWYTFTAYGEHLMSRQEGEDYG